jgi:hypothetical protein
MLSVANDDTAPELGGGPTARTVLFGLVYLGLTFAVSIVAFVHLRYGHCGELSSPASCEFVRGSGTPLLLLGPSGIVTLGWVIAIWRGRPAYLHLCASLAIGAVIILDVATIS